VDKKKKNLAACASMILLIGVEKVSAVEPVNFAVILESPDNTPGAVTQLTLENICPGILAGADAALSELNLICNAVTGVITATQAEIDLAIREISPKANSSTNTIREKTGNTRVSTAVTSRLSALRQATKASSRSSYSSLYDTPTYKQLAIFIADEEGGLLSQNFSGYLNVSRKSADQIETSTEIGFDSSSNSYSAGFDYRLKSSTFLGLMADFMTTSAKLTDSQSKVDANQLMFTAYGAHYVNRQWYVEGTLSNSQQQIELSRQIDFTLNNINTKLIAKGETASNQMQISAGTGYEIPLKQGFNSLVSFGFSYASTNINGYSETDAGSLNLVLDSQTITSLTTQVGTYLSKPLSTRFGVIIPQASFLWIHETDNEAQDVAARLQSDTSNTGFSFTTTAPDPNYFLAGIDIQFLMAHGRFGYIKYSSTLNLRDKSESAISAGFRMEF